MTAPTDRADAGAALILAVRALHHHPHLPEALAQGVRASAFAVVGAASLPASDPQRAARLARCEDDLVLCCSWLGLTPPVTRALAALARLRDAAVVPPPRRVLRPEPTREVGRPFSPTVPASCPAPP